MKVERIQKLIKQCDELGALISHWHRGFLYSVEKQLSRGGTLSTKQLGVIHRLEAKITKALKGDPEWEHEWTEQKAKDFNIAVGYYNSNDVRYHSQILEWVKDNPNSVPPRDFYQKLVKNKYAQKIINAINSEPKYPAGSAVTLRANCRNGVSFEDWNKIQSSMLPGVVFILYFQALPLKSLRLKSDGLKSIDPLKTPKRNGLIQIYLFNLTSKKQ